MDEEENKSQMSNDSMEENLDTMKNGASAVGNKVGDAVGNVASDATDKLKEKGKEAIQKKLKGTKLGKLQEKAKAKAEAVALETQKGTKKVVKGATTMGTGAALAGAGAATQAAGAAMSAAGKSITAATAGIGAAIGEAMDIAGQGMQQAGKSMVKGGKNLIKQGQKTMKKGAKQLAKAPLAKPGKSAGDESSIAPKMPKIDSGGGKKKSNVKKQLKALIGNNPKVKIAILAAAALAILILLVILFILMVSSTVERGKNIHGDYSNVPFVITEMGLDKLEVYSDGNGGYTYGFADEEGNPCTLDETLDKILDTLEKNDSHELEEMGKNKEERKEFLKLLIQAEVSTQFPDITISDSIDANDINGGVNGGTGTTPTTLGKDYIVKTDEPDTAPVLDEQGLKDAVNKSNLSEQAKQNLLSVIPDLVKYQEQYKVNAVFLMAVARTESSCGTDWDYIDPSTYNWLSVKGTRNGGYVDRNGTSWNKYSSFSEASEEFFKLISGSSNYFKGGKISVKQIAPTYCDAAWGESVTRYMDEFFQYAGAKSDIEIAAVNDASPGSSPAQSQSNIAQWGWVIQNENINAYYYEHGYGTITYSSPYVKGYITQDGKDYIVTSNSTGWYVGQGVQLRSNSGWNNFNIGLLNNHGVDTSSLQVGDTINAEIVDMVSQEIFEYMKNEIEGQARAKGLSLTENQIVALTDIAYLNGNVRTQLENIAKYGADSEQLANTSGFAPCGENDTPTSRAQNAWKLFHYGKYEARSGNPYDPQYFGGTPSTPGTNNGGNNGGDTNNGGDNGDSQGQQNGGAQAGGVDANGVTITSGGNIDFLNYAIDCHALLREDGFTYDSSGREMPVVRGDKVHTIDCVAYVSMVLDCYGKKDWQYYPHQLTSSTVITYGQSSLETVYSGRASSINEISDLQSGDIVVMSGHAQIFYGYNSSGQSVWLNCGNNTYISRPEGQDYGWYATPILYVFRVPGGSGNPYTDKVVPALTDNPTGGGGGGSSNLSAPDMKVLENNDDSVNGNITLKRKDESGNVKELKFIDEATFYRLLNANDERVMDYYTLKKGVGVNGNDEDFGENGGGGTGTGGAGGAGGATLSGSETKEQIWNFLIDSGCTEEGAAGLMGNLEAESGCKPVRVQGDYNHGNAEEYSANYTAKVDSGEISEHDFVYNGPGGGGYGLAQWTSSDRKQGLYNHVKSKGTSIGDLQSQLEYLIQELTTSYSAVWNVITTTHDINEASDIVLTKFERPKDISGNTPVRRNNAQTIYNTYAGSRSPGGNGGGDGLPTAQINPAEAVQVGMETAVQSAKAVQSPSRKAAGSSFDNCLFIGDSRYAGITTELEALGNNVTVCAVSSSKASDWQSVVKNGSGSVLGTSITLPSSASCVSVMLGANAPTQISEMKDIMQSLHNRYPNAKIVFNSVYHLGTNYTYANKDDVNANYDILNNEMKNFCSSNSDWAVYADITSGLHDENGYLKDQDKEGIHLVGDGKAQLVQNIKSQVGKAASSGQSNGGTTNPTDGGNNGGDTTNPTDGGNNGGDTTNPTDGGNNGGDTTNPTNGGNNSGDTTNPADSGNNGGDTTSPASGDMGTNAQNNNSSSSYCIVVASYQKKTITSVDSYTYSHTDVISTNSGTTGSGSQFSSTPTPYTTTNTTERYKATYIDYQSALKNHTLYFDFMWALFETTGNKDFIKNFAQEALDSKIEITVYPDKKVTTNVTQSGIQPKQVYSQDGSTVYIDYYDGSNTTTTTTTTIISRGCITLANVWTMEYENDADTYSEFKSKSKEVIREKIEKDDTIMKLLRKDNLNRRIRNEYYILERMIQDNGKVSHLLEVFKYYLLISLGTPKDEIELSEEIIDTNLFDLNKGNWASTVTVLMYTSINATEEEKEMLYAAVESMTSQFSDGAENTQRKKYITSVILNRVLSSKFPNTIAEVLQQSGQFPNYDSSSAGGTYSDDTKSAVDAVLQGGDCSKRSIYFNTPSGAKSLDWDTKYTKTLNDGDGSDNSYSYYTDKDVAAELSAYEVGVGAGDTTPSDKAQQIIAWAEAQVGKSSFYNAYRGTTLASDGNCAAFVKSAYYEAGFEYIGGNAGDLPHPNPIKFNADGTVDYSEIPAGAIIVSHGTPYKGVLYGHVCLYVGNGYVIEAGGSTIKKSPIDDSFGGKGHNCAPFIGWGFATNDQDAAYQQLVVSAPAASDGGGDGGSGIDGASYPQGWTPMDCGPWADGGKASSGSGILGVFNAGDKSYTAYCMGAGPWANTVIAEPSTWISDAGCGITSLSTIFTGFGINVTPQSFAGQHSAGDNYVEQHIREYGLNYKRLSGLGEVVAELKKGNPVIYHVRAGYTGGKYYKSGHYVALLGINSNGEIFVADPGSTHNCGYFPQSKFTGFVSAYSVFR